MLKIVPINYDWWYSPSFKEEYISNNYQDDSFVIVHLPHTNIEIPYNNFNDKIYQFQSLYKKEILIDNIGENERIYIRFEGVMSYARIYLNGQYIGENKGGYLPFRLDLTEEAIPNSANSLLVQVDSREKKDIPPFGGPMDYLTYGGIYREVFLEYCNNIHIEHLAIRTKDLLGPEPKIDLDLYIHNEEEENKNLLGQFQIVEKNDSLAYSFEHEIELKGQVQEKLTVSAILENIKLWDIDNPHIYQLKLKLIKDNISIGQYETNFAFRDIGFTEKGFFLNGRQIKLRGLSRHQSFPYVGYAMPKNAQYKDADILKYELGVNLVRLSHYPQSKHFLDRCDEIGLLVMEEIPGWRHVGNKLWQALLSKKVESMILNHINHPSIILWGIRVTESDDYNILYERVNALAKKLDNTRPTIGVRSIGDSELFEDVYGYNDYIHNGRNQGLNSRKKISKTNKGYLVTEYAGYMFPTKKFDNESRRRQQALRHLEVIEAMEADNDIAGAIGWSMCDYNTHGDFGSGDNISYYGVMDMFRIPKYAAYVYSSQQNMYPVMHIASSLNPGDYDGSLLEDIYVFTNCDYIKVYKNNRYIASYYPDKKTYPNLEHPPIIIDNLIGDAIEKNERFSKRDARIVKDLLIRYKKNDSSFAAIDNIKMGRILLKYKMDMVDAEKLYIKYLALRGSQAHIYRFEAYVGKKCLVRAIKGRVENPKLRLEIDREELIEDITYDVTRLVVRLIDDFGNDIIYSNDVITVETEGPIEVIGPNTLSLVGGSTGFWIKTNGGAGSGKVIINSPRFGNIEKEIQVF